MIIITSASYVNPELQVEFGKIPPSFLPLGAKRLYEHQVKLFEKREETMVLSLPESYSLDTVDHDKLLNLGVKVVYVKDGLSLGQSIIHVLNMLLPVDEHLSILHGDTFFMDLSTDLKISSIEIAKTDTSYNWQYILKDNKKFIDSDLDDLGNYIVSGYFNFSNAYEFIRCMTECDYTFSDGLKLYAKTNKMKLVKNDRWLDFGLSATYFQSRKSFTTERAFNSLTISDGYVTKCSEKTGKLQSEINWFKKLSNTLALYVPRFEEVENGKCYKTEYLYLSTLSELYVFGRLPSYVWKQIFKSTKQFLSILHSDSTDILTSKFDYKQKTVERLQEFSLEKDIDLSRNWLLNGKAIPSINFIVNDLDSLLEENDKVSFIHGDFCMSNIMYDFKSNSIKVYDPRGMDFSDTITVYGKSEYDNAKLMHSVFGLYDFIISGFYKLSYSQYDLDFHIEIPENILNIQNIYKEVFVDEDFKHLYAITIHLFLSMLPLHNDNEKKQYALLANAFRLYNELKRMQ